MGAAHVVQVQIQRADGSVDPRLGPVSAPIQNAFKIRIERDLVRGLDDPATKAARDMEPIQGHDTTLARVDPEDFGIIAPFGHRKNSDRISPQQ